MIKRELAVFLVVGSLTVLIDFLTYRGLVWTGWMSVDQAKAAGFLTGTLFAYFANKVWTFGHKEHAPGSVWRFVLLYAITLSANVLVNAGCLALLSTMSIAVPVAFLIATGVSAVLNFLGMKLFVFKTSNLEKS
ncbi:putative flippase GtrA [Pseudomonas sp. GGS8]|uniref:GtrA family protein n=1 Tax=Pseudomonas sp. GGS8 TaxID=2817892 RepID=UPI0020A1A7D7|nr:GtrA family protein [Pseudomonas sp. GGS8]MCP1446897.1 putative flippase GtrA [Pseudomonas sp. GGS8]